LTRLYAWIDDRLKAWIFKRSMLEMMGLRRPVLIRFVRFVKWLCGASD
jgi:hypothetical protein